MKAERINNNPLITPETEGFDASEGNNINGPSVIITPEWLTPRYGKYYMYFANHHGSYIRLAFADSLEGPWKIYGGGSLKLSDTCFDHHIASPDVHIDSNSREIIMFYHGKLKHNGIQYSSMAVSKDGINFRSLNSNLGEHYFRVISMNDKYYAFGHNETGTVVYVSQTMKGSYEKRHYILHNSRHTALYKKGNSLYFFYSKLFDNPERIKYGICSIVDDWETWQEQLEKEYELLSPEHDWEGANFEKKASEPGKAINVRQLRDPAILEEDDDLFLFYTIAGETGIACTKLFLKSE